MGLLDTIAPTPRNKLLGLLDVGWSLCRLMRSCEHLPHNISRPRLAKNS